MAVETHGPMDESTARFLGDLVRKITERSGDQLESRYFYSCRSVCFFNVLTPFFFARRFLFKKIVTYSHSSSAVFIVSFKPPGSLLPGVKKVIMIIKLSIYIFSQENSFSYIY